MVIHLSAPPIIKDTGGGCARISHMVHAEMLPGKDVPVERTRLWDHWRGLHRHLLSDSIRGRVLPGGGWAGVLHQTLAVSPWVCSSRGFMHQMEIKQVSLIRKVTKERSFEILSWR